MEPARSAYRDADGPVHVPATRQPGWSMFGVLALRDPRLAVHAVRSAALAQLLTAHLGVESSPTAFWGYLLHDIGTLDIPDSVVSKAGPLTTSEQSVLSTHTIRSAHLLSAAPGVRDAAEIALHHHERWDGKGYPGGLRGEAIPVHARVLAVADAYTAMTSPRPYRDAAPPEEALGVVAVEAASQFDPDVADALEDIFGSMPAPLRSQPDVQEIVGLVPGMVVHVGRAHELSRAQLEALYATALGLDAEQAADRFGRSTGTQRNWASSLRRTLACPARMPLPRFLAGMGRRVFERTLES